MDQSGNSITQRKSMDSCEGGESSRLQDTGKTEGFKGKWIERDDLMVDKIKGLSRDGSKDSLRNIDKIEGFLKRGPIPDSGEILWYRQDRGTFQERPNDTNERRIRRDPMTQTGLIRIDTMTQTRKRDSLGETLCHRESCWTLQERSYDTDRR